jgi:hypothetical protein
MPSSSWRTEVKRTLQPLGIQDIRRRRDPDRHWSRQLLLLNAYIVDFFAPASRSTEINMMLIQDCVGPDSRQTLSRLRLYGHARVERVYYISMGREGRSYGMISVQ